MQRTFSSFELDDNQYTATTTSSSGQSGTATLFTCPHAEPMMVKRPHSRASGLDDAKKELEYYRRLYPQLNVYIDQTQGDDYRLVMPYLGVELDTYLQKEYYDQPGQVIRICLKVIDELARIHALGITHYDAVMRNILIGENEKVFFIDGITHECNRATQKYDIRNLAVLIKSTVSHGYCIQVEKIKSLQDLRVATVSGNGPAYFGGLGGTSPMLGFGMFGYQPVQRSKQFNDALAMLEKNVCGLSNASLQQTVNAFISEVKIAHQIREITDLAAVNLLTSTTAYLQESQTPTTCQRYLAETRVSLKNSSCHSHTRKISRLMCVLAIGGLVAACVIPGMCIPAAFASALALIVFSVLAYASAKTDLQKSVESIGVEKIESSFSRQQQRLVLSFN